MPCFRQRGIGKSAERFIVGLAFPTEAGNPFFGAAFPFGRFDVKLQGFAVTVSGFFVGGLYSLNEFDSEFSHVKLQKKM